MPSFENIMRKHQTRSRAKPNNHAFRNRTPAPSHSIEHPLDPRQAKEVRAVLEQMTGDKAKKKKAEPPDR